MRSLSTQGRAIAASLALLLGAVIATQCSQPAAQPTQTESQTPSAPTVPVPPAWKLVWNGHYGQHIQPIFDQRCVSCHGATRADRQLKLDSYDGVMKGSQDGPAVVPGSPASSPLLSTVDGTATGSSRMPPTGPRLSDVEVQNIRIWIEAGAPRD